MKIVRLMNVREYEAFIKGKTIRPIRDHRNSKANNMGKCTKPMICFADEKDYFHIKDIFDDPCREQVLVCFEMNTNRVIKGVGYYYGDEEHDEYFVECYNRKTCKMLWHKAFPKFYWN